MKRDLLMRVLYYALANEKTKYVIFPKMPSAGGVNTASEPSNIQVVNP